MSKGSGREKSDQAVTQSRIPVARPGPEGGKRDQNRRARTSDLLEAAQDLFLARGVESVTIDEITRHAGCAKGNFYRYFDDKGDLVGALLEPARERVLCAFDRAERRVREAKGQADVEQGYRRLGRELAAALMGSLKL